MKAVVRKLTVLCLFLSAGLNCTKTNHEPNTGSATASLGDFNLEFTLDAMVSSLDATTFGFNFISNEIALTHLELALGNITRKKGSYHIEQHKPGSKVPDVLLFNISGDDYVVDNYDLLSTANNTLSITEIDPYKKEIAGTFDLTFAYNTLWGPKQGNLPDTFRLKNGVFWATYDE
jgi:hypothetical protein